MGCPKLEYNLSTEPRLRCVYNAADGEENHARNMNARLYDPVIGRMLSPDPYVHNPYFSQCYNRYAYVRNNPLIYTDRTGMDEEEPPVYYCWHSVIEIMARKPNTDLHIAPILIGGSSPGSQYDGRAGNSDHYGGGGGGGTPTQPDNGNNLLLHFVGPTLILLGTPFNIFKPYGDLGSRPGSSIASVVFRNIKKPLPSGLKILGTRGFGAALGRATPGLGFMVSAVDSWMTFYKSMDDLQFAPLYYDQNGDTYIYHGDPNNPYDPYW